MYLDSDSMPLAFPDDLFESRHYLLPGNLFFPEVWKEGVQEVSASSAHSQPVLHIIIKGT